MKHLLILIICIFSFGKANASQILIPMDDSQTNHLKAYGVAFWMLEHDIVIEWLLNYKGGSFMTPHLKAVEEELIVKGVRYEVIADGQANAIRSQIGSPEANMEIVQLEKAPKIAVYTPKGKQPWDDAVTLVLEYAEIPYEKIYDSAIIMGNLPKYDWLHLHHEDFTGQYGKFYASFHTYPWYQQQQAQLEAD
ncbi:MAG: asparagine synthetase B, partial [Fluviicola sp.]|nr:asparagine synthetase B [Fluviicola sp.]